MAEEMQSPENIGSTKSGDFVQRSFVKAFIFQYAGDEASFKQKIKELGATYFDDMYINIETYKGERIYNWN